MRMHDRQLRIPVEGGILGEALVQNAAERVDVGSRVDGLSFDLLGCRIVGRADEEAGLRRPARQRVLDDPEIGDVDTLGRLLDQDVRRLDVSVHEPSVVCGVQRTRRLLEEEQRPRDAESSVAREQRFEIRSAHISHRDVEFAVSLARVVDRNDVRVVDLGGPLRLALESCPEARVFAQGRREELDRDLPAQPHVLGEVDDAHATTADERLEAIASNVGPDTGSALVHRSWQPSSEGGPDLHPFVPWVAVAVVLREHGAS